MIVYLNGDYAEDNAPLISINDRGFLLGDGIFDTLLFKDDEIINGEAHHARLSDHASKMHLPFELDQAKFVEVIKKLVWDNELEVAAIRTTITRGSGARGLAVPEKEDTIPTILIKAAPFNPKTLSGPAKVIVAETRRNEGSILSRIKSLNYGDNILARMEADKAGADEAIMLNNAGNVACGTVSNVIIRDKKGRFKTPPLSDGVMDGVTRAALIRSENIIETSISNEDLYNAEDIFLTNSLIGKRPAFIL